MLILPLQAVVVQKKEQTLPLSSFKLATLLKPWHRCPVNSLQFKTLTINCSNHYNGIWIYCTIDDNVSSNSFHDITKEINNGGLKFTQTGILKSKAIIQKELQITSIDQSCWARLSFSLMRIYGIKLYWFPCGGNSKGQKVDVITTPLNKGDTFVTNCPLSMDCKPQFISAKERERALLPIGKAGVCNVILSHSQSYTRTKYILVSQL